MRFLNLDETTRPRIFALLSAVCDTLTADRADDGTVCWHPALSWPESDVRLTTVPLKTMLVPHREIVWSEQPSVDVRHPRALLGVPVCDLAAIAQLDRVFAADPFWQRQRHNLFLVGASCLSDAECFCSPWSGLPPCDLFAEAGRLWLVSPRAEELFARYDLPGGESADGPVLPLGHAVQKQDSPFVQSVPEADLLDLVAARCLGCGVCSAVCPTCHCFDLRDSVDDVGDVSRLRVWDSCQFVGHGRVAGGHNFRPRQQDRLHCRLEHKLQGFGPDHEEALCVGCGRCARSCPAGLGLRQILASARQARQ
jgi:ferredoxin